MKPESILITHLLLQSAHALTLPKDHAMASRDSSTKSTIDWAECDLDFGNEVVNKLQVSYQCARLSVPLDYTNKSHPETIQLDLIKANATKTPFKGSILYNPGGPGASGVEAIVSAGDAFVQLLGGHYDVIGFDTRGTGRTLPMSCNASDAKGASKRDENAAREGRSKRHQETVLRTWMWPDVKNATWQQAGSRADSCYEAHPDIGRLVGTTFVARDMMEIVDALGQGPEVNFWGSSYGSVLGQVLASMFPDRIGRMLLDANLLADDYLAGAWSGATQDAEKSLLHLFDECIQAGPALCSLAGNRTTADDLLKTFNGILREGIDLEIPGAEGYSRSAKTALFKYLIFADLYGPAKYAGAVARIEAALEGNATAIWASETGLISSWNPFGENALHAVSCSDAVFRAGNPDELFSMYQAHLAQGSFADSPAPDRLICGRWRFTAAEQADSNKLRRVKTASPVLFINGIYDPITPLSNAWEISARFPESRVVVHEGVGHGVIAHPSNCTNDIIAKYFTNGEMPQVETTCKPNLPVFEFVAQTKKMGGSEEPEEAEGPQ
ncbi:hypothetical protein F66182_5459 [Fusarium sp. NRRL 66182]|nr:hypothetical protein F66182_5459 [Fusarium sp. NRRL 66182]